ncbi:MAG TPA: metallophosphoesterase, partial [Cyclobacteriaceae bacterium]|nr:metallophosphoesterase [Cyclobacteriaceae bacterium]
IEEHCRGVEGLCGSKPEIWVDYVADLGDGFDSTYAIAYMIGQKVLSVGDLKLPRADCLIMGGDQVYPDASRDEYETRMKLPYRAAFPYQRNGEHPKLYLIPGNHDWYDGLTLFLANFCRGRDTSLGSWIASQRRSYFAIHLGANWWIWGFDSQLGEDIDKPQADYFTAIAEKMEPDAKVLLCASVPTWLKADIAGDKKGQEDYYRALHYIANIVREQCENAKIPVVLSGDLHHYSRYISKETGTNFITAGGGGAFLHPTHHLKDKIKAKWRLQDEFDVLEVGTASDGQIKSFYPPQKVSRLLALHNLRFVTTNKRFIPVLGGLYAVCALLMLAWNGYDGQYVSDGFFDNVTMLWSSPVFLLIVLAFWLGFVKTAEISSRTRRRWVGFFHALAHLGNLLFGTASVVTALEYVPFRSVPFFGDILYFFSFLIGM